MSPERLNRRGSSIFCLGTDSFIPGAVNNYERRFPLDLTGAEQWAKAFNDHLRREWERESGAHDGLRQELRKVEAQMTNVVNAIAAAQRRPFQPISVEKVLANWQRLREALHDGEVWERREKLRLFVREWWLDPDTYTMGAVFSHPLEVCNAESVVAPRGSMLMGDTFLDPLLQTPTIKSLFRYGQRADLAETLVVP